MAPFFHGAATMGLLVAALYFLRFWRETLDRLFLLFSLAFFILAVSYGVLGAFPLSTEWRAPVFSLRLVAFSLLIYGIVHKNRR